MKVLVIHGSMRKGNTYKLTQEVITKLRQNKDIKINEISINELNLPFCVSCHNCFKHGEHNCPHYKIISKVSDEIKTSDAIILTGVVYSMHLNAAMKNLIDHLSYYFHRPCLFDKKGMVITTTAGAGEKTVAKYLKSVMGIWGINNIKIISEKIQTVPFSLTDKQNIKIDKVVDSFLESILNNKIVPPSFNTVAIYNSFRGMSSAKNTISEYDKSYWNKTGLIKKTYPLKMGIIKKAFGTMIYNVLKEVINKNFKTEK